MLTHYIDNSDARRTACTIRVIFVHVTRNVDEVDCASCKEKREYLDDKYGRES